MSLWRQLTHGLHRLTHRSISDREIADEVEHFLEQATAEQIARGLPAAEARRAARLELGSPTSVHEQVREVGWENVVESLLADLRYAARRLRATPGFTLTATLTLALGIGAATAIASTVQAVLLQPLPYPHPERLVTIWDRARDGSRVEVTFGTHLELLTRTRGFEALAVFKTWQPAWSGPAEPERLEGQSVSAGYFRVLGVEPALGRGFEGEDDRGDAPGVVILSDALWRHRFGADPAILGRALTLHGDSYVVIGVMPPDFVNVLAPSAQLWRPLRYELSGGPAWGHHLRMVGRLRAPADLELAARELDEIARTPHAELPRPTWASLEKGLVVSPLGDDVTRGIRPTLLLLFGAVLLLLAIACVNVTNLLFARGLDRRGELALRATLGAGRGRLVRQLLIESLLLAALGGLGGLAVATAGVRSVVALAPASLPRIETLGVDGSVFVLGFLLAGLTGLAFGLSPALQASRRDPRGDLELASRRTAGGRRGARAALVIAEVALSLLLLVGAGLLLRSLGRLLAVDSGFDSSHVLTLQVETAGPRFDDASATHRFFEQALEAVRQVPGVAAAALTSQLPLRGEGDRYGIHLESTPAERPEGDGAAFRYAVSPGYAETLGIPLVRGRFLDSGDRPDTPRVALISESMARRRFPGLDPLGQRIHIGPPEGTPYTVVGVVGDVKQMSLALDEADAVYVPDSQWHFADGARWFVLRARGEAAPLAAAVRQAIWSIDRDQPIVNVAVMDDLVAASTAKQRFALVVLAAFALASMVLAGAGIYGVVAGSVAERTREVGVRAALGASRGELVALVIRQGLTLTGLGIVLGLLAAVTASEALESLLFGISNLDPATYLGVVAVLSLVATTACALPAWRAARIHPASSLRAP